MNLIQVCHRVTQASFFALLLLLILWVTLLYPWQHLPMWTSLLLVTFPLAFAVPGILRQRLYTYAWAQFVNML